MSDMFCFQCQQTAGNKCCVSVGVCGKQPDTAALQDELVYELIRLAEAAAAAGQRTQIADRLLMDGLFITLTNVNFDNQAIAEFTDRVRAERERFAVRRARWSSCGTATRIRFRCVPRCCSA